MPVTRKGGERVERSWVETLSFAPLLSIRDSGNIGFGLRGYLSWKISTFTAKFHSYYSLFDNELSDQKGVGTWDCGE